LLRWLLSSLHQVSSTTAVPRSERFFCLKVSLPSYLRCYISQSCGGALTNTTSGIRAECLTRYPGGEGICTTSVHPSWHATGILKGAEKALNKYGIYPDPPSNVSDLVVDQVLKGRSGRLIVPKREEGKTGLRNWPMWAQDLVYGFVGKRKGDRFGFGKDDNSKLALDPSLV
jgi:hypothetical protein